MRRQAMLALAAGDLAAGAAHAAPALRDEAPAEAIVARLIGTATPQGGRIRLELPEIAESGIRVPLKLFVDSPMTPADHVRLVHLVAERNPRPWVASSQYGPHSGRAELETYIRLKDSQSVTAPAQMSDGRWWKQSARHGDRRRL